MPLEPPKASERQIQEEPLATPVKVGTSGTPPGPSAKILGVSPGGFIDLIGTSDLASPMSWSGMSIFNTEKLPKWQSVMPEGIFQGTPPVFRISSESPPPNR